MAVALTVTKDGSREKKIHSFNTSLECSLLCSAGSVFHDRISVDSNFVLCVTISRPVSVTASCFFLLLCLSNRLLACLPWTFCVLRKEADILAMPFAFVSCPLWLVVPVFPATVRFL